MPPTKTDPSERLLKLVTGPGEDIYRASDLIDIAHAMADVEIKLAEYENDETVRRRADALKIRTLEREICTCPWPADAAKTRHLLSCRLMQMEHEALRAKENQDGTTD